MQAGGFFCAKRRKLGMIATKKIETVVKYLAGSIKKATQLLFIYSEKQVTKEH